MIVKEETLRAKAQLEYIKKQRGMHLDDQQSHISEVKMLDEKYLEPTEEAENESSASEKVYFKDRTIETTDEPMDIEVDCSLIEEPENLTIGADFFVKNSIKLK